jgi:hypothetical protein
MATAIKLGDWIKQGYAEYVDPKSHGPVTRGNTEVCMVFLRKQFPSVEGPPPPFHLMESCVPEHHSP